MARRVRADTFPRCPTESGPNGDASLCPRVFDADSTAQFPHLGQITEIALPRKATTTVARDRRRGHSAPCAAEMRMEEAVAIEVGGSVTRLPWECYLLRGALDVDAQRRLLDRVGSLAGDAFERWPEVAAAQDHPCIVTSHSANAQRPRECRRACGLERCHGHCGRRRRALRRPGGRVRGGAGGGATRGEGGAGGARRRSPVRPDALLGTRVRRQGREAR